VRAQAQWLAESGVQRAAARLRAAADYRGETWEIPADLLGSGHPAAVTIEVRTTAGDPSRRELHVVSRYPADGTRAATCERTIVLPTAQEAVSSTDN
jgi:hypothetical protein